MGLVFTYLLCYGGAVVALFNPFAGLLVYVCFAILKPEALWPWAVSQGRYSLTVALALLVGWALKGFGSWRLGKAWGITLAFVAFWLWAVLSATRAPDQERAWYWVDIVFKILLPFVVGVTIIDTARKLRQLVWVIFLSQSYLALEFNRYFLSGFNYIREVGFANMEEGSIAIGMVSALGMGLVLVLHAQGWWRKALAFVCCGLLAHVVLFSFNRGGMLGMISAGVAAAVFLPNTRRKAIILPLGAALVLSLAGPEVMARFSTTFADSSARDGSAQSRLELWANCLDSMQKNPILGLGPWHFPLMAESEYGWGFKKEGHTLWLQIGAELGVPGLAFLLLFYGLGLLRLWPLTWKRAKVPDPWLREAACMVMISTVGFAVSAQFISLSLLENPYYVMLLGASILKLCAAPAAAGPAAGTWGPAPAPAAGGLLLAPGGPG
jgi:O-antigen ligase